MKKKKLLSILLSAALAFSLTACGNSNNEAQTSNSASSSTSTTTTESKDASASDADDSTNTAAAEADPFGKYADPLEIHFVRATDDTIETNVLANLPGQTLEDNFWLDTYEDELGIKVVYDWIVKGDDEFNQKMNVSMASEELPDVMCVTATQMMQLIDAGLVQEMGPVFEQYATDFTKEVMNQEGDSPFLAGQKDGVQYGLPVTNGSVDSVDLMWIRTDWLEKLNLEVPTTMDEVLTMVDQFVNADFDGNGSRDTVGIGVAGTSMLGGGFGGLRGFFNAYGAYPGIWVEKDGQLAYGAIQPECKTALAALHDMYEKGYIDTEFGVKDSTKAGEAAAAGKCGFTFGQQWLSLTPFQSCKDNDPDSQWSAYPLPSATGEPAVAQADLGTNRWIAVNKNFEHPEAVVKMINLFIEKCWGETGDNGKYYAPPEAEGVWKLSPIQCSMPHKNLQAYLDIEAARQSGDTSSLTGEAKSIQNKLDSYYSGSDEGFALWGWERIYGPDPSSYSSINAMSEDNRIMINKFVGAPTETMTEKLSTLETMRDEVYTKIIIGEASIDEFDTFVEDFNKLGGSDMTAEVNEWYSSVK